MATGAWWSGPAGSVVVVTDMQWYWCLTHQRAEAADQRDDPENTLGPYASAEAARDWKQTADDRAEKWKEQDEAWSGDEPDDEGKAP